MKRKKHFKAGIDKREFGLIKAILKEMYGEYNNVHNKDIDDADELHIKIEYAL